MVTLPGFTVRSVSNCRPALDATVIWTVTEPPEDGRANRAVCAAVADLLHVAPSAVSVTAGASSREKTLRVTGDPAALSARLAAL